MTECKVLITQHSCITDENGETDEIKTEASGVLRKSAASLTLTYSERCEEGTTLCRVRIAGDTVTVERRGAILSELRFRTGETHRSLYRIPPYSFDMELTTHALSVKEEAGCLTVSVTYTATVGGASQKTRFCLTACAKGEPACL